MNLTQLQVLGNLWNSDVLLEVFDTLSRESDSANSGDLVGNRMFYANDFAVSISAFYSCHGF